MNDQLLTAAKNALEFIQSIDGYENCVTATNLRRAIEEAENEEEENEEEAYNPYLLHGEELDKAINNLYK